MSNLKPDNHSKEESLKAIENQKLYSVIFILDYIQLRFDGPLLTILTPITVKTNIKQLSSGNLGFRDALCDRIDKFVKKTRLIEGESIEIEFDDQSVISLSLKDEDYPGPEAVLFDNPTQGIWNVW